MKTSILKKALALLTAAVLLIGLVPAGAVPVLRVTAEEPPEGAVITVNSAEELAAALEDLPTELTDVIVLHYYGGRPLSEIAVSLNISYGAVKIRHNKAIALLRSALK